MSRAGLSAGSDRCGRRRGLSIAIGLIQLGPLVLLIVLWVVLSFASQYFFTGLNITNLLQAAAVTAVLAVGQFLVILSGALDLSAAAVLTLTTIVGAKFAHGVSDNGPLVCLVMIAAGALAGAVNALLIEWLRLGSPFIITLATLSAATGACYLLTNGTTLVGMPALVNDVANNKVAGVPISTVVVLAFAGAVALFTLRVAWGRWIYAIGDSREAGARVGIPVRTVAGSVFVMSGLAAGIGGIFTAGLTNSTSSSPSFNSELDAISAVVIGGVALTGGRGYALGALVGALVIATIHNGLNLLNVSANWEPIALGLVLVTAIAIDQVRGRVETTLRLRQAASCGGQRAAVEEEAEPMVLA